MDTASVRAKRVTAMAESPRDLMVSKLRSGEDRGGRLLGKAPTVRISVTSWPKTRLST